jgi:hypothetical protein
MSNPWKSLIDLTQAVPRMVGKVLSHNDDGTSTVQLPEGGTLNAFGQEVAVDAWAFIRDGRQIDGPAPAYGEVLEIEI